MLFLHLPVLRFNPRVVGFKRAFYGTKTFQGAMTFQKKLMLTQLCYQNIFYCTNDKSREAVKQVN